MSKAVIIYVGAPEGFEAMAETVGTAAECVHVEAEAGPLSRP